MNVFEMITNYFKDGNHGVSGYEPIGFRRKNETEDYLYVVIARYIGECEWKKGTYAVWTSFNTSMDGGNMNYGHYELSFEDALTVFNGEEIKPISWDRMSELATKFKDGLNLDDKEEALKYFTEECEMTDKELEYFGIEKPIKYKRVNVEVNFNFEMVIPEDVDEEYFAENGLNLGDILSDGCGERIYTDVKEEEIDAERAKRMLECDCYGELNPDYC